MYVAIVGVSHARLFKNARLKRGKMGVTLHRSYHYYIIPAHFENNINFKT